MQEIPPQQQFPMDLIPRNQHGLRLQNPVIIAAGAFGTDGLGAGWPTESSPTLLGAVVMKTLTPEPRTGNPEPRTYPPSFRAADPDRAILLNSVGLANPGIEHALRHLAPTWQHLDTTVVLSLAADTPEDLARMTRMTQEVPGFQAIELNLSCPNTQTRQAAAHSARATNAMVLAARRNTTLPILAKLAPNVPDIIPIIHAAQQAGADAITIGNTIPAMLLNSSTGEPVLSAGPGGMSGQGLRPICLALVHQARRETDLPIFGAGGIFTADHARQYLLAGASAVQLASAAIINPVTPARIAAELIAQHGAAPENPQATTT